MGWMFEFERKQVESMHGRPSQHRCDYEECRLPIFVDQLLVIDSKAGYHKRPPGASPHVGNLMARKTYHQWCWDLMRGKTPHVEPGARMGPVQKGGAKKPKDAKQIAPKRVKRDDDKPKQPREAKEKVDGLFTVGSVQAAVYALLKDGHKHKLKEVKKTIAPFGDQYTPKAQVNAVSRKGEGKFDIKWHGDEEVRLTMTGEKPHGEGKEKAKHKNKKR